MDYIGEHLLPGKLGHFFVVLSFVSSLVATIAYFNASRSTDFNEQVRWKKYARIAFIVDFASVLATFFTIYFIIRSHLFEYNFAWEHSSNALDFKYLLSCIWEAQEGSFLLWTMWHGVLGIILIFTAKSWEGPVLTVISFAQWCLSTMVLGVYFFGFKLGNSPFLLVRELFSEAPIFNRPDYLSIPQMKDGQGLNALLQNYWMVIHPPILFLGFASTIVPFSFAIAGLWKKQYGGWTKKALPWSLFSACVLGTGIMMGAAWAYESLTFGGYWAWDPVENASLVPWLVLVAGVHTQVIFNSTGYSLRATYLFLILQFGLVLYSTFLTRSGILGDTSVHAFVASGMDFQLVLFILVFMAPALTWLILDYKKIPHIAREENTFSREFWMFIGSLVIFLAALFITVVTSLPVINKLGTNYAVGDDPTFTYNRILIFVAILLGLLAGVSQYLKYKNTTKQMFLRKIGVPSLIALVAAMVISIWGGVHYQKYGPGFLAAIHLALFAAVYSVITNAAYIWVGMNGKFRAAGASVAHVGFGLILLGILVSSSRKEVLSFNTTGINISFDPKLKENPLENITLLKNLTTDMGQYWATYLNSDSVNETGNIIYFRINFKDKKTGKEFDLYPNLIRNTKGMENYSNNPDKHHYWDRDIFSYINYANVMDRQKDTSQYQAYPVAVKDTIYYSNGYMILDKVTVNPVNDKYHFSPSDTALMAEITVVGRDSIRHQARPVLYVKDNQSHFIPDTVFSQNLALVLSRVTDEKKIELRVKESTALVPYISLKVFAFPQINILWIGIIIMIIGFIMSIVRRVRALPFAVR